ncbi:hypothetical protein [Roseibium alexandrii]|uniref:Uncharacterized protein n=1 Tax=Roseibium alexandrii (strain DSM 17067 / NCIMB 14079 / DFL-11) TaxID=244592 RepID=A0A5E8GVF9_ROSAD|nr:hypothetical protein SADFL11_1061 [Roseibium alexandrii DFL-11]
MSFFEYKGQEALGLVSHARDLMIYSYHGIEDILQPGNSEEAARQEIEAKGWTVLTPDDLGIPAADIDRNGTFQGETTQFKDAQADVLARFDEPVPSPRSVWLFEERPARSTTSSAIRSAMLSITWNSSARIRTMLSGRFRS